MSHPLPIHGRLPMNRSLSESLRLPSAIKAPRCAGIKVLRSGRFPAFRGAPPAAGADPGGAACRQARPGRLAPAAPLCGRLRAAGGAPGRPPRGPRQPREGSHATRRGRGAGGGARPQDGPGGVTATERRAAPGASGGCRRQPPMQASYGRPRDGLRERGSAGGHGGQRGRGPRGLDGRRSPWRLGASGGARPPDGGRVEGTGKDGRRVQCEREGDTPVRERLARCRDSSVECGALLQQARF